MAALHFLLEAWELLPVLALLVVGAMIAIQSGLGPSGEPLSSRRIAASVSRTLLRVVGYVVALLAVQHAIGHRPILGW